MPIFKVQKNKTTFYRWGKTGKLYRTRKRALQQARAIYAGGYKKGRA